VRGWIPGWIEHGLQWHSTQLAPVAVTGGMAEGGRSVVTRNGQVMALLADYSSSNNGSNVNLYNMSTKSTINLAYGSSGSSSFNFVYPLGITEQGQALFVSGSDSSDGSAPSTQQIMAVSLDNPSMPITFFSMGPDEMISEMAPDGTLYGEHYSNDPQTSTSELFMVKNGVRKPITFTGSGNSYPMAANDTYALFGIFDMNATTRTAMRINRSARTNPNRAVWIPAVHSLSRAAKTRGAGPATSMAVLNTASGQLSSGQPIYPTSINDQNVVAGMTDSTDGSAVVPVIWTIGSPNLVRLPIPTRFSGGIANGVIGSMAFGSVFTEGTTDHSIGVIWEGNQTLNVNDLLSQHNELLIQVDQVVAISGDTMVVTGSVAGSDQKTIFLRKADFKSGSRAEKLFAH
jgi:hypothetical protein